MERQVVVSKVLNNNVIIANHQTYKEVVLIGKGIGFNRKKGDHVALNQAEKTYLLTDKKDREDYMQLVSHTDDELMQFLHEVIFYIEERMEQPLNEHIHIALTDHLTFALKRVNRDIQFKNPFIIEIESLYPKAYQVASEVVEMFKIRLGVDFPIGEIGFIALHIHSAVSDKKIRDLNKHHLLIKQMIKVIEQSMEIKLVKDDINFSRLIQHLHRAIDRVYHGERIGKQNNLAEVLKQTYPLCYNTAWKLIKIMQKKLNRPVDETEVIYLTIHLQRLTNQI